MAEQTMTMTETITTTTKPSLPTHTISPSNPHITSLSYLTLTDPNPLPFTASLLALPRKELNTELQSVARTATQSLITTLLTSPSITIKSLPDGLTMTLPHATDTDLRLPRWKPLPKIKQQTKWEAFAKKKGIGKFGGGMQKGGAALTEKRRNATYNEETGEWDKKWGHGKKRVENEWLVEVDEKKEKIEEGGKSVRGEPKREKMERMRRQERKERNNARRGRKAGG